MKFLSYSNFLKTKLISYSSENLFLQKVSHFLQVFFLELRNSDRLFTDPLDRHLLEYIVIP